MVIRDALRGVVLWHKYVTYETIAQYVEGVDWLRSITNNHQAKVSTTVSGIHLYGHFLVLCNLGDISHTFKIAADGSLVNTILDGKLFYGLLPVYIIGDYL